MPRVAPADPSPAFGVLEMAGGFSSLKSCWQHLEPETLCVGSAPRRAQGTWGAAGGRDGARRVLGASPCSSLYSVVGSALSLLAPLPCASFLGGSQAPTPTHCCLQPGVGDLSPLT